MADEPPKTTDDGLQLQESRDARLVYVRPGATLAPYKRIAILECQVEDEENWQRRYNQSNRNLADRVTDQDAAEIKAALAAEFVKVFTEELQTKGGYQVVDHEAPDVLVLRPALLNLMVTAPDVNNTAMTRTLVSSAGQMTLFLELYDSVSKELLARIIDPKEDPESFAKQANRVTNKAAADKCCVTGRTSCASTWTPCTGRRPGSPAGAEGTGPRARPYWGGKLPTGDGTFHPSFPSAPR